MRSKFNLLFIHILLVNNSVQMRRDKLGPPVICTNLSVSSRTTIKMSLTEIQITMYLAPLSMEPYSLIRVWDSRRLKQLPEFETDWFGYF